MQIKKFNKKKKMNKNKKIMKTLKINLALFPKKTLQIYYQKKKIFIYQTLILVSLKK